MFFQNLAAAATKEAGPDAFLNVASTNGSFDIFQSARDQISTALYKAGIAGVVTRQAYKIYEGVSSILSSSSPASPFNPATIQPQQQKDKKSESKMRKEWSQGSMRRLENFLRIGASSYSCHLGSNVREYIKKVFDPPQSAVTSTTTTAPLTREEKIAKIVNQAKSRLSGLVVTSVIHSYLFTIEVVLSTVVHPVALYELHKIRMAFEEERIKTLNHNSSQEDQQRQLLLAQQQQQTMMNNMMMGGDQQIPNDGGWLSKAINVAMKVTVGDAPPPELLQPPPNLELSSALPGNVPSAEAENTTTTIVKNGDDDDEDEEEQNKSNNKQLNVVILQIIRALKQDTEAFLQQELENAVIASSSSSTNTEKSSNDQFENPVNRVSTKKIEEILIRAIQNPKLFSHFASSCCMEWMIDLSFGSSDNFTNYTHFHGNEQQNNNTNKIDPVVNQVYYRLLNQIVCTDSFVQLMKKSSFIVFEQVALPLMDGAWKTCKSYRSASEVALLKQQQQNGNGSAESGSVTTIKEGEKESSSSQYEASVQILHIGGALTSSVYQAAETELTKILLPELFLDQQNEEKTNKKNEQEETATMIDENGEEIQVVNNNNNQQQEQEDDEATMEKKMKERQMKMIRKFPSFGDLSSYGGLCLQFARFTIECNVGGGFVADF